MKSVQQFIARNARKVKMLSLALGISMVEAAQRLMAVDADATVIVSAGTAAFALVAAACISIGTFFVVYRIVKRTK